MQVSTRQAAAGLAAWLLLLLAGPTRGGESGDYVPVDPSDALTHAYEQRAIQEHASIPRVSERDPNPEGGPRLWVAKFQLDDIVEYPERGITKASVAKFLEGVRKEYLADDQIVAAGFTQHELEEIGTFLDRLGIHDENPRISVFDVEELEDIVRAQKERRGFTQAQLEQVAARLTNFYRERGLFLARAYVPVQEVSDGIVKLHVLEGRLGEVAVSENQRYTDRRLSEPFEPQLESTVKRESIEEALYLLNDLPGLDVYGTFTAGERVGETRLKLNVRGEKRVSASMRFDNHGSEFTGQDRGFLVVDWLNMTGIADQLSLGVLQTANPANNTYGYIDYAVPVGRNSITASASSSAFVIGSGEGNDDIGELELSGDNKVFELGVRHQFTRGRQRNLSAGLTLSRKSSDLTSAVQEFSDLDQTQDINSFAFNAGFDKLFEQKQMLIQGQFLLDLGNIGSGALPGQKKNFWKAAYTWSSLVFVNSSPRSDRSDRIIVRSVGQYTSRTLPALEQFPLGGADLVRGFSSSTFSGDRGVVLGVDWFPYVPVFDSILFGKTRVSDLFQILLFADAAYGQRLGIGDDPDQWAAFSSIGAGIQVNWRDRLNGRVNIAFPMTGSISDDGFVADVAKRVYADITWKLH